MCSYLCIIHYTEDKNRTLILRICCSMIEMNLVSGCRSLLSVTDCPAGRFGNNCEHECHCADLSEACDSILGMCSSGCAQGWSGFNCQKRKCVHMDFDQ